MQETSARWRVAVLVAALTLHAPVLFALDATMQFHRLTVRDGLVQGTVNAIHQDATGFLWFGTADGLSRFDGYRFVNYRHQRSDPRTLSDNFVRAIGQDAAGDLWIGTQRGLNRFDPARESFESYLRETAIRALHLDQTGTLWAGTDAGLYRWAPVQGVFEPVVMPDHWPEIYAIAAHDTGDLWLGTRNLGLLKLRHTTFDQPLFESVAALEGRSVLAAHVDRMGQHWLGTQDGGLFQLQTDGTVVRQWRHRASDPSSLIDNRVNAIAEDDSGRLWVATFGGLNRLRDDYTIARYQHEPANAESLALGEVRSLAMGFSGQLWVGVSPGGVSRFDPTPVFETWGPQALGNDLGLCIATTLSGTIWVGTANGLVEVQPAVDQPRIFRADDNDPGSLSSSYIRSCSASQNELWVGTQDGLNRYHSAGDRFESYLHDPADPDSLSDPVVRRMLRTSSGELWLGTGRGVNRFRWETRDIQRIVAGIPSALDDLYVTAMLEGARGEIWIGSHAGLYRLTPDLELTHYVHDPTRAGSLGHSIVNDIYRSQAGTMWVGTNAGLNRMTETQDGFTFEVFGREAGFRSEAISDIAEDGVGRLWIATFEGISRFDPNTGTVRNFGPDDGTLPDYAVASSAVAMDGTIYFGGLGGVTRFRPDAIDENPVPPRVVLTDLRLSGPGAPTIQGSIHTLESLTLDHGVTDLTIEFAALHYAAPRRNRYEYRLDGLHNGWIETDADQRIAGFANLSPGEYAFRVRASNKDGVWQTSEAGLVLTIRPPWWMTWWARMLFALTFVITILGIFRMRFRSLTLRQAELTNLVAARTRELEKKNDELSAANRAMEELSMTDPLTGLNNRRFLLRRIREDAAIVTRRFKDWVERDAAAPADSDLSFFLIDLDRFKEVNDKYGHAVGDEILIQTRGIFSSVLRETDFCARWGGEEFLVVTRYGQREQAAGLAERLRSALEDHTFNLPDNLSLKMTWSIGFASFPFVPTQPDLLTWAQVVNVADRCLYAAKRSSRNAWVGVETLEGMKYDGGLSQRLQSAPQELAAAGLLRVRTSVPGEPTWG